EGHPPRAKEENPATPGTTEAQPQAPGQAQQLQVPVDVSSLTSGYVNWFRFTGSAEELIIDLGLAPQLGQVPPAEPIKLTHRLVMNFYTAKRLLQNLNRAVGIYESHYRAQDTDMHRRRRTPPQPARLAFPPLPRSGGEGGKSSPTRARASCTAPPARVPPSAPRRPAPGAPGRPPPRGRRRAAAPGRTFAE